MNKYDYWKLVRILKTEYDKQYTGYYEPTDTVFVDSFDRYVQEQYGIKMWIHRDGKIDGTFEIVDEGKYAWFLLKHK